MLVSLRDSISQKEPEVSRESKSPMLQMTVCHLVLEFALVPMINDGHKSTEDTFQAFLRPDDNAN